MDSIIHVISRYGYLIILFGVWASVCLTAAEVLRRLREEKVGESGG